ncbi:hypothetical protein [Actinoplanes sp. CA-252034]|uniref:hypothetical protein n=1 Tax=Actinoplanes sp. CA-252034 TaxID=3239906 RepID=UPI003D981628
MPKLTGHRVIPAARAFQISARAGNSIAEAGASGSTSMPEPSVPEQSVLKPGVPKRSLPVPRAPALSVPEPRAPALSVLKPGMLKPGVPECSWVALLIG